MQFPVYFFLTAFCLLASFGGVVILIVLVIRKIAGEQRRAALTDEARDRLPVEETCSPPLDRVS